MAATILGSYALESLIFGVGPSAGVLGLVPSLGVATRPWTLFSVLVVHGSWMHAILNTLGLLAFGTPVARWFGSGRWIRFLALYLTCALLSSLGYLLIHRTSPVALVGASGAISGLMGASSRLLDRGPALASFASRTVLAMASAWLAINLLMAVGWVDPGAGGAPIAWDAHLVGYGAGLLLIGPFGVRRRVQPRGNAGA